MKKLMCCLMLLLVPVSAYPQRRPSIFILFPTFDSADAGPLKESIGKRAATILSLQIWRDLRKVNPRNPGIRFGIGGIGWDFDSPPPKGFAQAESLAQLNGNQFVLWGKASQYGNGIVVEPYLSICNFTNGAAMGSNIWQITTAQGRSLSRVTVDIPERRYEFSPLVIESNLLPNIIEITKVPIYNKPGGRSTGYLGDSFIATPHREADWAQVQLRPSNRIGWINFQAVHSLSSPNDPSELVEFCGGVIRIFRGDWEGAIELFQKVVAYRATSVTIKIYAYLYMAIAADKLNSHQQRYTFISEAYKLNPYFSTTTKYLCMHFLSEIVRLSAKANQAAERQSAIENLQRILAKNKVLFEEGDPWIAKMKAALRPFES